MIEAGPNAPLVMPKDTIIAISKRLSYVLRHRPDSIGLQLDPKGWAEVDGLLERLRAHGLAIERAVLERVVRDNDKQRFAFSVDGSRIRASQGHSIEVDLGLQPRVAPPVLYHGTATRFLKAILAEGLRAGARHHVHLSGDVQSATRVGMRHGFPAVLRVDAARMQREGATFYESDNGVWLTGVVAPRYLSVMERPS